MNRRALVTVLAAVIAVAVAIPALADSGPTAKIASVKGLSVRALAKAKAALRAARAAKRDLHAAAGSANDAHESATAARDSATAAQASATAAQAAAGLAAEKAASAREVAGGAELKAKEAKEEVASTRVKIGFAEGKVVTESETFADLGGPVVKVDVPTSNLIQVWGVAEVEGEGAVSLYEDGEPAEGQAKCGIEDVLFAASTSVGEPELVGTPALANAGGCSSAGAPGPVLFRATTGEHTFELRYAACECATEPVAFSKRRLVIAPLP